MSQLMRVDCFQKYDDSERSLLELTTSGMTHSWGSCASPQLRHHTHWYAPYAKFSSKFLMEVLHRVFQWPDIVSSSDPDNSHDSRVLFENGGAEGAKKGKQYALADNFGELEFHWDSDLVSLRVFGKDYDKPPLMSARWSLEQLSGITKIPGGNLKNRLLAQNVLRDTSSRVGWTCLPHRGASNGIRVFIGHVVGSTLLFTLLLLPCVFCTLCMTYLVKRFLKHTKKKSHLKMKNIKHA
mmetsp:Transcript_39909/g.93682  ORF Transcript_39909/g.93682 Transcript_39909/m.93682 type:complete len:239 (+) Transcript_39909:1125-1841(+)